MDFIFLLKGYDLMPILIFDSATATTLTFRVFGDVDWVVYRTIYWELYNSTSDLIGSFESTGTTQTFGNSTPLLGGRTYTCFATGVGYNSQDDILFGSASGTTIVPRPSYFSWTTAKTSGGNFNLSASEWAGIQSNINQVRSYKGFSSYGFTSVSQNMTFFATLYNEVSNAIYGMNPSTSLPIITETGTINANSGNQIKANYMNGIVSSLNSIS